MTTENIMINFDLTPDEMTKLHQVLLFAYDTAKFVLEVESKKGSSAGAEKIARYMADAEEMIKVLQSIIASIDRPADEDLN